jgi:TPR repeat protein
MARQCRSLIAILGILFSAQVAPCQIASSGELRAKARALTLANLSEQIERAKLGDNESLVMTGLGLQILAKQAHRIDEIEQSRGLYKLAASWFIEAAQKGYAPAQYFLAARLYQYEVGYLGPIDCDQAWNWLEKAIAQEYVPAMTLKGWLHLEGPCDMLDRRLGIEWLKKAAEHGDARAYSRLGELHYLQGTTTAISEAEAIRYYVRGAELGDPDAQVRIGVLSMQASGAIPDSEDVPEIFKKLMGMRPNVSAALEMLQKAAAQGSRDGACALAEIYAEGLGVPEDYVTSLMWGLIADQHATEIGCLSECLPDLVNMTPEQDSEAKRRADDWLKENDFPTLPPRPLRSINELQKPE